MKLADKITEWIKEHVHSADKKGVIFGLSGGIDSAVVAGLAKRSLGDNVLGLILPCKSSSEDEKFALSIAKKFDIKTEKVILDETYDALIRAYPEGNDLAKANLKPRLRMLTLYYFANTLDHIVAGTGNKSELMVGYFTKHGDGGVDILPLGDLLKTEVRELAKELGVPEEIIKRPPTAGLWEGQTDETELGITYDDLDRTLIAIEHKNESGVDKKMLSKVKSLIEASVHKRANLPIFKK